MNENILRVNIHGTKASVATHNTSVWLDVPITGGGLTLFFEPADAKAIGQALIEAGDQVLARLAMDEQPA